LSKDISLISDNQAEAGVIATVIAHPEFALNITYLKPGYFYNVENGCIYWSILELQKNGVDNIDAFNITSMLNSNKAVKAKIGEYGILNDFQKFIDMSQYTARNTIEEYKILVDIVVSLAFKRELNKVAIEIQNECFRNDSTLDSLNKDINDKINGLTSKFILGTNSELLGDRVDRLWDDICSKRNDDGTYGMPSIIPLFNEYFTYAKGELILLKARMKKGKSLFFMNEAIHKAIHNNIPTLYIDTEMSDEQFLKRTLCNLTGIEVRRIEAGRYNEEEAKMIEDAKTKIKNAPLVHEYIPEKFNPTKIEALCQNWKNKMNLQFVVYDYMKYMGEGSASEVSNLLGGICDFLKNTIAGKMDTAVLAGAQLNRSDEVASSDAIERHCSTSIMWREKTADEIQTDSLRGGNFCAAINLNRNGRQHGDDEYISIVLDGDHMRVSQAKFQGNKIDPFS